MEIVFGLLGILFLLAIFAAVVLLAIFAAKKIGLIGAEGSYNLPWQSFKDSLLLRAGIVAILTLLMAAPLDMVESMVRERSSLYHSVLNDIARTWGKQQKLSGPTLLIPYTEKHIKLERITDKEGNERTVSKTIYKHYTAIALPEDLNIQADLKEERRKRSLYESLVYQAELNISGSFKRPDLNQLSEDIHQIHWNKAWLSLGITDTQAIKNVSALAWNKEAIDFEPGTRITKLITQGFHAPLNLDANQSKYDFGLTLNVNGSHGLFFEPFGKSTNVTMTANWPHPSFQGSVLPDKRDITDAGFTAGWHIPHLARNYPQLWTIGVQSFNIHEFEAGALLFEPVSLYSQITRAIKYGILFIALTYITFLIFELAIKQRLHWVQYGIIGLALSIFYLMLLSLSEHIGFFSAYLLSAITIIIMISTYVYAALRHRKQAIVIATLLTGLYSILYSLLKLEDYALLMGTFLLVVILGVMMYFTRNTGR